MFKAHQNENRRFILFQQWPVNVHFCTTKVQCYPRKVNEGTPLIMQKNQTGLEDGGKSFPHFICNYAQKKIEETFITVLIFACLPKRRSYPTNSHTLRDTTLYTTFCRFQKFCRLINILPQKLIFSPGAVCSSDGGFGSSVGIL